MEKSKVNAMLLEALENGKLDEIKEKLKEWNLSLGMTDYSVLKTSRKLETNEEEENEA